MFSGRIVVLTTYCIGLIIISSYSASFLSYLMARVFKPPFKNFRELLNDGTYPLGVQANSAELDNFKNSPNKLMNEIYNKLIHPSINTLPQSSLEGLNRVCAWRKYSWMIAEINAFSYNKQLSCKLFPVSEAFIPGFASMAIKKNSPYKAIIKI
ncbi:hypothetical protein L9F63_024892, partial [Diploptera punctata]